MPVVDILSAALSGPAGRVVEGPVRTIVNEVLQEHGYASPAEVQALKDDLAGLRELVAGLAAEVDALQKEAAALKTRAEAVREATPAAKPAAAKPAAAKPAAAKPAAAKPAAKPAAAKPAKGKPAKAAAAAAERLGLSPADYDRWRAGKLPGHIGPDGYVSIGGVDYRVDAALEGRAYTLSQHKSPRVMVDGAYIGKTKLD